MQYEDIRDRHPSTIWNDYLEVSLERPVRRWVDDHPTVLKVCVVAGELIRMIPMFALLTVLPYSPLINCGIALGGSLFYRVALERCPYKFAISSCIGGMAAYASRDGLHHLIDGVALRSFEGFTHTSVQLLPIVAYGFAVVYLSHIAVNQILEDRRRRIL